jgi:hypothetical protein
MNQSTTGSMSALMANAQAPAPPHRAPLQPRRPWVTMHGDTGSVTINLREVMRGELFAASRDRRRIIAAWIKARDAEGEVANIAQPDVPVGTRLGPRMKAKR